MKALLKMNPAERLTAAEALRHPYFEGMTEVDPSSVQKGNSNKKASDFKQEISSNVLTR